MRISDWSSDVCSSDLHSGNAPVVSKQPASRSKRQLHQSKALDLVTQSAQYAASRREIRRVGRRRGSAPQIGRASCRERVCSYVEISVVAGTLKNTKHNHTRPANTQTHQNKI